MRSATKRDLSGSIGEVQCRVSTTAVAVLALGPLLALEACFISSSPIQVPAGDARSLLIVSTAEGRAPRVYAIAPATDQIGYVSYPRRGEASFTLYVLQYGCTLERLGLRAGEIGVRVAGDAGAPLPRARRPPLVAHVDEGARGDFKAIGALPPGVAAIRLDVDFAAGSAPSACCTDYLATATIAPALGACQKAFCPAKVSRDLERCEFTIDLRACNLSLSGDFGLVRGSIAASGDIAIEPPAPPVSCRPAPTEARAAASFSCTAPASCALSVYLSPPKPLFEVRTATVIAGVPRFRPPGLTASDGPYRGYLSEVAVLRDRVVVVSFGGALNDRVRSCGLEAQKTLLHFFDPESLELTRTATAPPCLTKILALPDGDGFLGIHGGRAPDGRTFAFQLGRFDRLGRETGSTELTIPLEEFQDQNYGYWAAGLTYTLETPPALAAIFAADYFLLEQNHIQREYLFTFRPSSFEIDQRYELTRFAGGRRLEVRGLVAVPLPGRLAWVEDDPDIVRWLDDAVSGNRMGALISGDEGQFIYHAISSRIVVPSSDVLRGVFAVGREDRFGVQNRAEFPFERDLACTVVQVWPSDPRLVIVGGTLASGPTRDAMVSLFDPGAEGEGRPPRFVPGLQRIGYGAPSRMVSDAQARIWTLLPWSGHLVRIAAAHP